MAIYGKPQLVYRQADMANHHPVGMSAPLAEFAPCLSITYRVLPAA